MKIFKKTVLTLVIVIIVLLSSTGLTKENREKEEIKEVEKEKYYSMLSGKEISYDNSKDPIFAVMLDNHPSARPQSGLNDADIIYEFKAEGQYTRYLAIFQTNKSTQIGPVRSARPYFVNTAGEYDAIYAHWGGSDAGYAQISDYDVKDLDGIFLEGSTYYRNKDVKKYAPHNGYTNYELLKKSAEDFGYLNDIDPKTNLKFDTSSDLENIKEEMDDIKATKMSFDFFKNFYNMTFEYDEENNNYKAYRNGDVLIDEKDGTEVRPSNIILQFADSKVTGPKLTLTIDHIGTGSGKLFTNGKVIDITWEKSSELSPTIFKDHNGNYITLSPGLTLVEVLDEDDNVEILPSIEDQEKEKERLILEKDKEEKRKEEEYNNSSFTEKVKYKVNEFFEKDKEEEYNNN